MPTLDLFSAVSGAWNVLWPIGEIALGFAIGSGILKMLQRSLGDPPGDPLFLDHDQGAADLAQAAPTPLKHSSRACHYCGGEYNGDKCPNCGAPRQDIRR